SLSAGISEVIEVMMAKQKERRYNDVEELLDDLKAVLDGEAPLRAHKRFDVSELEQLEKGDAIEEQEQEKSYQEDSVMRYRVVIIILGAAVAVSVLVIFLLLLKLAH
ncbi:unnamed protein product, partial [marine sediment metagenome]